MKRILLSVFAAAVAAAWSMPADAADVTFGGQYRLRGELRNNADFEDSTKDSSSSIGQRVRITANAKATDDTSVKITIQDTRTWGAAQASAGGPSLTDINEDGGSGNDIDLHESYVNIENLFGQPVSFRAGRQELAYGDERLIGAFNWSNNGRSFDAFKLMYKSTPADVDFFASKVREASANDNDQDFYGLYATVKVIPNNTLDLYALLLRDGRSGTVASPQTTFGFGHVIGNTTVTSGTITVDNAQTLWTYGARLKGSVAGLDYTAEIPFQTGDFKTFDGTNKKDYSISGYAYAVKVGYTLPTALKLRVGAEYDFASGDDNAGTSTSTDTDIKTFFNLFPTNHDKLGYMDLQGWRNVQAWSLNARLDVNEKLAVYAAYWDFKLAEKNDAWYAAGDWNTVPSSALRINNNSLTAGIEKDDDVGSEIDLVATYKYNNAVTAEVGYSRFFTGGVADAYFRNTAATTDSSADQDWAYLQITANF